jgi:hypothetical protein
MKKFILVFCSLLLMPIFASAHQPRLVGRGVTEIKNPEVSQAFYGELQGSAQEFRIVSDQDFRLYVGLLLPNIDGINEDISVEISRINPEGSALVALLDGKDFQWTPFFEDFGKDSYLWGPEFAAKDSKKGEELKGQKMSTGTYMIKVYSPDNSGKYSLVVGDAEIFSFSEMLKASINVPHIKRQFFGYSPLTVLASPFGWAYVLVLFVLAFAFGLLYRFLLRLLSKKATSYKAPKNIGKFDRWVRATLGLVLLVFAMMTTWNPFIIFLAGFCFFEALFSWCGFYAAIGKNSCPIN